MIPLHQPVTRILKSGLFKFAPVWHDVGFSPHPQFPVNQPMKKVLLLLSLLSAMIGRAHAQANNAILFTENGERFQVILNGVLQNASPETNVRLTSLVAPNYKCRIIFEDTKLGHLDFNMFFNDPGSEVTWNIKKNNKGEYVTRWVSSVPLAQAPPAPANQTVVVYTTTPPPPVAVATPATTTTTTTVQQSQSSSSGNMGMGDENISLNMGINVGGEGGSISINASGMGMDDGMSSSSSSSTTTTTTTTHSVTTTTTGAPGTVVVAPAPAPAPPPAQVVYVVGYNGPIGCPVPMAPNDFQSFKQSVQSKDFENTKLTIAKQVIQNNCLTADQVREPMTLFDFENTKLDFAKFAYDRTYDRANYYKVNDAFEFESSIEDLNRYIGGR